MAITSRRMILKDSMMNMGGDGEEKEIGKSPDDGYYRLGRYLLGGMRELIGRSNGDKDRPSGSLWNLKEKH